MAVFVVLDPIVVRVSDLAALTYNGTVQVLDPIGVRLPSNKAVAFFSRNLAPASGVARDAAAQRWIAVSGIPGDATAMGIASTRIYEGESPTFLARLVRADGTYPILEHIEDIRLFIWDESGDDPTELHHSQDIEPEGAFFNLLQKDGYTARVPGGYNFRWQLDDETVRLEGGRCYRFEFLVRYTGTRSPSVEIFRITVDPVWGVEQGII
jgi:hypothetical protein